MKVDTVKKFLPFVVILIAILGMVYMVKHRIKPKRATVTETVIPVDVMPVAYETTRINIPAQGTVAPAVQVAVKPEVGGRITSINPDLVPGGTFRKGDILFQIDTRDYQMMVATQEQTLASAELALKQEQARGRVAQREWELLDDSVAGGPADQELALRVPQLKQAEAAANAAKETLAKARLDLDRCTVRAPFNGLIIRESVDPGQVVGTQSEAAIMAGTDTYWVQASIPVEHLRFIEFPDGKRKGSEVVIRQDTGNGGIQRKGHVERLLGDLTEAGRLARILVTIPDPTRISGDHDLPLLLGSFVNAEILGRELSNVVRIPRSALHTVERGAAGQMKAHDAVWIMNGEDRLSIRDVIVEWRTETEVFIHNSLKPGERLILSNIATPIEGMKLTRNAEDTGASR